MPLFIVLFFFKSLSTFIIADLKFFSFISEVIFLLTDFSFGVTYSCFFTCLHIFDWMHLLCILHCWVMDSVAFKFWDLFWEAVICGAAWSFWGFVEVGAEISYFGASTISKAYPIWSLYWMSWVFSKESPFLLVRNGYLPAL